MTLSRQLMLSGLALLLMLFIGILSFSVKNSQVFFSEQLRSHSQDTATALGLTLTLTTKENDVVLANRIVDAVWDRGYYSLIEVQSSSGAVIVERKMQSKVYNVPHWLIELVPLNTARQEALIMDGWKKIGKVVVESNPGFAYSQIWATLVAAAKWLLLTAVIAMLLGGMLLYIILRPLNAITAQAIAICNQEFPVQTRLPWTLDLRKVVEAMNNMSSRLKKLFEEQAETSARLREQAYKDPVTQLANRRYFDLQIDYLLKNPEEGKKGVLLLVEIHDFKKINDQYGYQEGDRLLIVVAQSIQEACKGQENSIITHAKGASFFVILPNKTKAVGEAVASAICTIFDELHERNLSPVQNIGHIGLTVFSPGEPKKEVISRADMALRAAQVAGDNGWHIDDLQVSQVHAATEWHGIFEDAIQHDGVMLNYQKTILLDERRVEEKKLYETLMRLRGEKGEMLPASVFMPMAEQFGFMGVLDQAVIRKVVENILKGDEKIVYFVNLSPSTLDHIQAQKWILGQIKSLGGRANQIAIEMPEHAVVHRLEATRVFYREAALLGARTSIDHYGNSFSSFSYLYNLKLNYLKLDGGFVRGIHNSEGNQFFIRSLVDIAHSLDIYIIAVSVETKEEYDTLLQLRVDGIQGAYLGRPSDVII